MQLTAAEALKSFLHNGVYLFLGAAFATTGLLAAAFLVLRRRFDALLFWFSLFAIFYGVRLWIIFGFLVPLHLWTQFARFAAAFDIVVAIPAFFFFNATEILGRFGRILTYLFTALMMCLLVAAFMGAPVSWLRYINSILVITALLALLTQFFTTRVHSRDAVILRAGLLVFSAFALWNNFVTSVFSIPSPNVEPVGFAVLIGCFGYVAALRMLERDQQLRAIQKELDVARRIQLSILPSEFPASANFRVAARYVPMTSVAGDFYDFLAAGDHEAGLLIADVSGHGVPAALIASMVKVASTSQREHITQPLQLLSGINVTLCGNTQGQLVTAAYVYLNAARSTLRYAAAGHPPMLLLRAGEALPVEANGLVLAAFPSAEYVERELPLKHGDRILLYTDGIVEAANAAGEFLGQDGLASLLKKTIGMSPEDGVGFLFAEIEKWAPEQDDDRTIILCDYVGEQSKIS